MGAGVRQIGGVSVGGGQILGIPSPAGDWSPQWDDQTVDFDRDEFARVIADKGYSVTWEKAVLCPNIPRTGLGQRDHDINCPVCGGFEFVYVDPVQTQMLMMGITLTQSYHAYGRWDVGQMMVTAMPEYTINYWDRLTLMNGSVRLTQRIMRQSNTEFDLLKYPALSLDFVVAADRNKKQVNFRVGTDVQLSFDGTSVQWLQDVPDSGQFYSVAYTFRPRYVVLNLLHHHRESTVQGTHYPFPVRAIAKLDFLVRDEGKDPQQGRFVDPFTQEPPR